MPFLLSINRSDGLKKLQDTNAHDESESLRQSARGEQTYLPVLKKSVAKTIEMLLLSMRRNDNKVTNVD
jgi:hypothetical protein